MISVAIMATKTVGERFAKAVKKKYGKPKKAWKEMGFKKNISVKEFKKALKMLDLELNDDEKKLLRKDLDPTGAKVIKKRVRDLQRYVCSHAILSHKIIHRTSSISLNRSIWPKQSKRGSLALRNKLQ